MHPRLLAILTHETSSRVVRSRAAIAAVFLAIALASHALAQPDVTVIEITDKVLVEDVVRLGINLGGDTYYSGAALVKKRAQENFEGTSYRRCHFGPGSDEHGASTWSSGKWGDWDTILKGGKFTLLSGPSAWTTGTVMDITTKKFMHGQQLKDFRYFVFDKTVKPMPFNGGFMVESMRLRDGQFRPLDGFWTSKHNEISTGDVPPGSFGCAALCLRGSQAKAHVRFGTHYQRYGENNGTWHFRFWAKAKAGSPTLTISLQRGWGESKRVSPGPEWTQYHETLVLDNVPEPKSTKDNPMPFFAFEAERGDVLLDDVEIWMEGDTNPTAFRDDCVATLKEFSPGQLRYLQMGGSTVDNTLAPILRSHTYNSQPNARLGPYQFNCRDSYSLHELYELCEYLGCDPWYSLPGTLTREEVVNFMEYLGAPADVGYGKKRAEMGHPKPWTEVFKNIHVEFGNEAWNSALAYQCGGFNGPDYWKSLIGTGKASPYYKPNVLFHAGGQASYVARNVGIMENSPNADRFSVAPYIIHELSQKQLQVLDTDEKLFRWVLAYPVWRSRSPDGAMFQNFQAVKKAGMELSVYEVNHHITHGDAPAEPRNRIVASIAGGINVANTMLMMLKEHHIRTQCLFALAQHSYRAQGVGEVRLWGTTLCMRKGQERYRPTFLACAAANKAIAGDLVQTVHSGAAPTWSAQGVFLRKWRQEPKVTTYGNIPCLVSYAFRDGSKRGLLIVNLDVARELAVTVRFQGDVVGASASSWLLSARSLTANNEYETGTPQVTLVRGEIRDFSAGTHLTCPACSIRAIAWRVK